MSSPSNSTSNPYDSSVDNLAKGLLQNFQPPLEDVQKQLNELTAKQGALITQIHDENLKLAEAQFSPELQDIFQKMAVYQNKLVNIKKKMKNLHERSSRLKKRTARIQEEKEKERQAKIQKELELEREQQLIGKGSGVVLRTSEGSSSTKKA